MHVHVFTHTIRNHIVMSYKILNAVLFYLYCVTGHAIISFYLIVAAFPFESCCLQPKIKSFVTSSILLYYELNIVECECVCVCARVCVTSILDNSNTIDID